MKTNALRIAAVSDVSIGYGSPQVSMLMRSLADQYGARALVFEPDQSGMHPLRQIAPNCAIQRAILSVSPHTQRGRVEYISSVARELNRLRPDVLVIFCTYSLPVLFRLNYRPRLTIYVSIESILAYGDFDVEMNRHAASMIDLVVFPEENRARLDGARCGLTQVPMAIIYNTANSATSNTAVPAASRLERILYSGTIERGRTLAEHFLRDEVCSVPIDLFGSIRGADKQDLQASLLNLVGNVRYRGYVDAGTLSQLRKNYAFSIVMWAPINENQLYAAPNKFFEAIADGVPPIAAPHPQCKMLINRFKCGILMKDWSFECFREALQYALQMFGTDRYGEMVENCRRAVEQELNWDAQFAKIKRLLPERL